MNEQQQQQEVAQGLPSAQPFKPMAAPRTLSEVTFAGEKYLTMRGAAKSLGVSEATMSLWAMKGRGPEFVYVDYFGNGGKMRAYRPNVVEAWRAEHPIHVSHDRVIYYKKELQGNKPIGERLIWGMKGLERYLKCTSGTIQYYFRKYGKPAVAKSEPHGGSWAAVDAYTRDTVEKWVTDNNISVSESRKKAGRKAWVTMRKEGKTRRERSDKGQQQPGHAPKKPVLNPVGLSGDVNTLLQRVGEQAVREKLAELGYVESVTRAIEALGTARDALTATESALQDLLGGLKALG